MIDLAGKKVIISRTDSIGDVMLTLPACTWIKNRFDNVTIIFLGKGYTKEVVEAFKDVDDFLDWEELDKLSPLDQTKRISNMDVDTIIHVFPNREIAHIAKKAKIPNRIGTSHRLFHLLTCNFRPKFTRKRSDLHESQLNHELLRPLGLTDLPSLDQIVATTSNFQVQETALPQEFSSLKGYTILHPKSQGSAKEWPIEKYMELASGLANGGKTVVFTGTQSEGAQFKGLIPSDENIIDTTGKLSLKQLMCLINKADNLVACSTGPLHISGFLGVNTVGLYAPKRPIHPGRWAALGPHVNILVNDENCQACLDGADCNCIQNITVEAVLQKLK